MTEPNATLHLFEKHIPAIMKRMDQMDEIIQHAQQRGVPTSPDRQRRYTIGIEDLGRHAPALKRQFQQLGIAIPLGGGKRAYVDAGDHLLRSLQLNDRPYRKADFWKAIIETIVSPPPNANVYPYPLERGYVRDRMVPTRMAIGYERKVAIEGQEQTIHVRVTPCNEAGDVFELRVAMNARDFDDAHAKFISAYYVDKDKIGRPKPRMDPQEMGLFRKAQDMLARVRALVKEAPVPSEPTAKPVL